MVGIPVPVEIERYLKPWTIYLSIHQRYDEPMGEFQWSIVMTLDTGFLCVVYRAANMHLSTIVPADWRIEENVPGQWNAETSPSLLCLFQVRLCMRADVMADHRNIISRLGQVILAHRSVSGMRPPQAFSSKTFALDLLAQTLNMNILQSQSLEECATSAALMCRQEAMAANELMKPNRFKVFRVEIVNPVVYPSPYPPL